MLMQLTPSAGGRAAAVLEDLARPRFVRLRSRAPGSGSSQSTVVWRESVLSAVREADARTILLVQLPAGEFLSRHQVAAVYGAVAAQRERTRGASGECYTLVGAAFDVPESPLQEDITEDLAFVWERVAATRKDPACPRLAMLALLNAGVEMRLVVNAPVRSATESLAHHLTAFPVISAELLSMRAGNEDVPNYRWSQRLTRLKEIGLLMPIAPQLARTQAVQEAHAEAVGRKIDRRRTRLYRSVAWDLLRSRRGGSDGELGPTL